jgi:ribosomal protein L22
VTVDEGARLWRVKARAMGRASWIRKTTSHVTVVLDER